MSDPIPSGLPFIAINAPSPPDDPPAPKVRFAGLRVRPYTRLKVSDHYEGSITLDAMLALIMHAYK